SFDNEEIGRITSGTMSPTSGASIGIAYVATRFAELGTEFNVDIRGRKTRAKVVPTPFVKIGLSQK
ncbi:MAG: glycine cleavage T C-terminal barrel domain-containing protein, partial [Bdellovibrionota bacterium]